MDTLLTKLKIALVGLFFLVFVSNLKAQDGSEFSYDDCKNQITFRLQIAHQEEENGVGSCASDFANNYHDGTVEIRQGSESKKIFDLSYEAGHHTKSGWQHFHINGQKSDRTIYFKKSEGISATVGGYDTDKNDFKCTGLNAQTNHEWKTYVDITIDVPSDMTGEGQKIKAFVGGNWDSNSNYRSWSSSEVTTPDIPRIVGPLELEPLCDGVELEWGKPSFFCTNASFVIYRDGVYITAVSFNTLKWKDTNVTYDNASDHKYEVLVRHNSEVSDLGLPISVEGNPVKNFNSSDYFESVSLNTTNFCNQAVRLQWEIDDQVDIDYFEVERDVTDQFLSPIVNTVTQTFGTISYDETGVPVNQDFYYRIKAYDDCNNETYIDEADIQHVMFEGPPSKPIITKIEPATDGTDQATITWSYPDDGTSVNSYRVYRDGSDRSGKLPAGTTSFVDEGLSNCLEYEYMVIAEKDCFDDANSMRVQQMISFNTDLNGFDDFSASKYYYNDRVSLKWAVSENNGASEIVVYRKRDGSEDNPEIVKRFDINSSTFDDYDTEPGVLYEYGILAISCSEYKPSKDEIALMTKDVGVRSETGIINGKITYQGGNAVKGVRVLATPSDGENRGVSLNMAGNQLTIPLEKNEENWFPDSWTLSFWFRMNDNSAGSSILEVTDAGDYLKINSNSEGQTEFYEIDYREESAIVGIEDELVGYQDANGEVLSLKDKTILGRIDGENFTEYQKVEIAGLASGDTLYDFASHKPWLLKQGNEWFELTKNTTSIAIADSLFGYLQGDTVYEAFDSDFVLAFIDSDQLRLANHFNISYQLGVAYASIKNNEMIFADDTTVRADIIDDIIYSEEGEPIHMIVGSNLYYVYKDELNGKLVRGKRFARKMPNETDPNVSFDIFLLEKTITEEIQKGELLGIVSTDRTKVFEAGGMGLTKYLIDTKGVIHSAVYTEAEIYEPAISYSYGTEGHTLVDASSSREEYLFNGEEDTLYRISIRQGVIDESGFVQDPLTDEYLFFLGSELDEERQVFKAIGEQVDYIQQDTLSTYTKEAYQAQLRIKAGDLSSEQLLVTPELYMGEFNNILMTYDGSQLIYYINGKSIDTLQVTGLTNLFKADDQEIRFGGYNGVQDETLLWSEAKDSTKVKQDFNRYLSGGESNLMGYWRLDEKVSTNSFDASYSLDNTGKKVFNAHHAQVDQALWSNIVPEQEDLSFTAFTDGDGNYSIQSIIYSGSGNNFKLVPILGTHGFEPSNKILFVGPSQQIQNDKNFTDNSAFRVTGTVKYDPRILGFETTDDPDAPNCYVEGVKLYVDDQPVVEGTNFVTTDKNGRFEIDVPIGKHQIKVAKDNHTYAMATWPPEGTYNFQDGVNDLVFYDNTTRKLIGKVVGGTTEASKVSGSAESINNIGVAEITLKSIGKTCYETVISTNPTTGEFQVDLPPFRYNVVDLRIPSQTTNFNRNLKKLAESSIDLSRDDLELDAVACTGSTCGMDSTFFHLNRDFIYRTPAQFTVKQYRELSGELIEVPALLGAESYQVGEMTLDFRNSPFQYEVFTPGDYIWGITLSEEYENHDEYILDPIHNEIFYYNDTIRSGEILIDNEIADHTVSMSLGNGEVIYKFLTGEPSLLMDRQNPEQSFTKTVQIIGSTTSWRDTDLFRGILLGTSKDDSQKSFYTVSQEQYQVVDMVLRDPPGSQSYTEFLQKSKFTKVRSSSYKRGVQQQGSLKVGTFIKWTNPFTGIEEINLKNTIGFVENTNQYREAKETSVISFTEGIKLTTSKENKNTGAGSDIFVGNALNIFYSPSYNLDIVPIDSCGGANECYASSFFSEGKEYAFSRSQSISFGLQEATLFYYTQRQIEQLIADLEKNLASVSDPIDQNKLRNQIRIWKSAIAQNEYDKLMAKHAVSRNETGYRTENITFGYGTEVERSYELGVTNDFQYSQQYSWYTALDIHIETAFKGFYQNFDFQIGNAVYVDQADKAEGSDNQSTTIHFQDNNPGDQYAVDLILSGANYATDSAVISMNDLYTQFDQGLAAIPASAGSIKDADTNFKYQIPAKTDYINPVFITKGGRTSCPYEPEEKAKYLEFLHPNLLEELKSKSIISDYSPHSLDQYRYVIAQSSNQDYVLNYGTFQRDQPGFRIEPRVLRDIPWDQNNRATFDLILENHNAEDTIRTYNLVVDQRTTGAGPTMRLDGERFIKGTDIPLYGGEQLQKKITIRPVENVYDYENIVVYLVAGCQFDFGQDLDFQEDIYARDTLSVYFTPACPQATVITPTEGWIINNQTETKLSVEIQEQSYYFVNHNKVKLQFKATYQTDEDWVDAAVWSRDSTEVDEQVAIGEDYFYFPVDNNYIVYDLDIEGYNLPDGTYQIRWVYYCTNGLESFSAPVSGVIDRTSPHAFGRPSPADGVLSPNDEIVLTLNEPIEAGLVDRDFISVKGKINGTTLVHPTSVRFSDSKTDQVVIDHVQLKNTAITVEMWVRMDQEFANREQVIFSHAESGGTTLRLGLQSDGRLKLSLNDQELVSDQTVSLDTWSHLAFSLDPSENKASLYHNGSLIGFNETFAALHYANASIVIGGENEQSFTGNIHEFRLWGKYMNAADLVENYYTDLTGREIGLLGYWPLNEGRGTISQDVVQGRNAQVNANWWSEPSSLSFDFDGSNYVELPSQAFDDDADFTIEFWFKAAGTSIADTMTLVSTGNIDGLDWEININLMGQITLVHNGQNFILVSQSVLDQKWHHLALVVNRVGYTTTYYDTVLKSTHSSELFAGLGGPNVLLGARLVMSPSVPKSIHDLFVGQMDEFRIWRMAKRAEQIGRMANYKLEGTEFGMVCYLPFETYDDFLRISTGSIQIWDEYASGMVATSALSQYSLEQPGISLKPYETPVFFNYSVSGDKMIITLDDENPASVENCTLDISVRNLVDKNGNVMKSPVTWSVYVDRNQVKWKDRKVAFEKFVNEPLSFTRSIVNEGGENQNFIIDNLPTWLSANPSSGVIGPGNEEDITFVVNTGLNIGEYQEPLHLRTSFGFDETLLLSLKVSQQLPADWTFVPEDFQYSMSFIGQIMISDEYSTDEEDVIAVFVNDSLRGMASLGYQEVYDNYQAFMSVYSNRLSGETLEFRIWDASKGKVLNDIDIPEIAQSPIGFVQNQIYGRPSAPVSFRSDNHVISKFDIPKGWKWVSFNLESDDLLRTRNIFQAGMNVDGDRIISMDAIDIYDQDNGLWIGSLAGDNLPPNTGGLLVENSYRIHSSQAQELTISGLPVETQSRPVSLYSPTSAIRPKMWNWIGFSAQDNMEVNEALSSLNPSDGDIIKSQYAFAIYDPVLKWVGNLEYMSPGQGYMIQVANDQQLTFPRSGLINASSRRNEVLDTYSQTNFNPHLYLDNMSMVVRVIGLDLGAETPYLEVYHEDQLRGVSSAREVDGQSLYYLSAFGNADEELVFKLRFENAAYPLDESRQFLVSAIEGSINDPVIFNFQLDEDVHLGSNVFPNPFEDEVTFVFALDERGFSQLRVISMDGRILIDREFIGDREEVIKFEWNGMDDHGQMLKPGIYLFDIQSSNYQKQQLLIKE
ncbi:hypothetical protein N6H18_08285 [Reichenbachiella agarivorans]|uniref:Fibronectin type-III domain-containing protein n=1 Tax=Reichenbachiella agarivorans TaxID=2979464 RepID=A0ABY6CTU7_9BACT|nr:LamG-like jellyroll fold domain-containing protein [Reichenbachiella agarivorans]UXP33941.1 hypothetical protein N6H18_08285 [Reichenbachiella agarivorans]